jgi:pyruvate/2-oxoglutarate dehydrogenase complex dihydrolipoamide dehydrogenase (E3) component
MTSWAGSFDDLDRLLDWKLAGVLRQHDKQEEATIQRQFTIELRVDYADNEKNQSMRIACQQAAQHINATAVLLADGQKPQIAVFSDDFYSGREEIELITNTIQAGLDSIGGDASESQVSDEMRNAFGGA